MVAPWIGLLSNREFLMPNNVQPRLEHHSEDFERTLILAGALVLAIGLWIGGAFEVESCLHAAKGSRAAFIGKFLVWDHNALTKIVLNPFLARPMLFLLCASALALAPVAYGMSKGLWKDSHSAAFWAVGIALMLGLAYLLPQLLLPSTLSPFGQAWWRTTVFLGPAATVFSRRIPARQGR